VIIRRHRRALGLLFEDRWRRFDEAVAGLRALLRGGSYPDGSRFYPVPADLELEPAPRLEGGIPLWIGSWGSTAGLRRVARAGDGWLASAYNTTPERFARARSRLATELEELGRTGGGFPNALATMWTWVTDDRPGGRADVG
jgi:alkanesulfonate monooxygenase SsuD/methylene tetrahydromethanopterin reductase-like flavin-dependent oxidoreductase (luciferase family)